MAGIFGLPSLQFVSRGATKFKYVRLLQEETAKKERERSDTIEGQRVGGAQQP